MNEIVLYVCNNKDCGHITATPNHHNGVCCQCNSPTVGLVEYTRKELIDAATRVYRIDHLRKPLIKNAVLRQVLNSISLVSYDGLHQSSYDAQYVLAEFLDSLTQHIPDLPSRLGKFALTRLDNRDVLSIVFEISVGKNVVTGIIDEGTDNVKKFMKDQLNPLVEMTVEDWVSCITESDTDETTLPNIF